MYIEPKDYKRLVGLCIPDLEIGKHGYRDEMRLSLIWTPKGTLITKVGEETRRV
jgi:hypothetical protein